MARSRIRRELTPPGGIGAGAGVPNPSGVDLESLRPGQFVAEAGDRQISNIPGVGQPLATGGVDLERAATVGRELRTRGQQKDLERIAKQRAALKAQRVRTLALSATKEEQQRQARAVETKAQREADQERRHERNVAEIRAAKVEPAQALAGGRAAAAKITGAARTEEARIDSEARKALGLAEIVSDERIANLKESSATARLTQDGITKEAFTERYDDIWRSAALTGLDYEIVSSFILNPRQSQVRLQTALHSLAAGDINRDLQMDLTLEDEAWTVAWSDGLILPELESGRNLFLDVVTPTRANIYDRNGLALAANSEAVALWIVPNQIGDEDAELAMLSTVRRLMDYPSNDSIQFLYDQIRNTDFRINLGEVPLEAFQQVQGTLSGVGGVQWIHQPIW